MKKLAKRIRRFVDKYAGVRPDYDPDYDDFDEMYTGPDPYELLSVAEAIEAGREYRYPHSNWGSGCYKPYTSKKGELEHDDIMSEIKKYRTGTHYDRLAAKYPNL